MAKKKTSKKKTGSKKKSSKKAPAKKKGTTKKAGKKTAKKKARRTVMYSSAGKKLYAKRDAGGKFKDIQQYSRAHAADMRRSSAAEQAAEAAAPAPAPANNGTGM